MLLDKKELEFYNWDGDLSQLLQNVREKLNKVAEVISSRPLKFHVISLLVRFYNRQ